MIQKLNIIFFNSIAVSPERALDIVIAISTVGTYAQESFSQVKDVVKELVDNHPLSSTKYGVIIYSDSPSTKASFSDDYPSDDDFKRLIDSIPRSSGGSVMEKALGEAKKMFDSGSRENAKKVLVIFTDEASTGRLKTARHLHVIVAGMQ